MDEIQRLFADINNLKEFLKNFDANYRMLTYNQRVLYTEYDIKKLLEFDNRLNNIYLEIFERYKIAETLKQNNLIDNAHTKKLNIKQELQQKIEIIYKEFLPQTPKSKSITYEMLSEHFTNILQTIDHLKQTANSRNLFPKLDLDGLQDSINKLSRSLSEIHIEHMGLNKSYEAVFKDVSFFLKEMQQKLQAFDSQALDTKHQAQNKTIKKYQALDALAQEIETIYQQAKALHQKTQLTIPEALLQKFHTLLSGEGMNSLTETRGKIQKELTTLEALRDAVKEQKMACLRTIIDSKMTIILELHKYLSDITKSGSQAKDVYKNIDRHANKIYEILGEESVFSRRQEAYIKQATEFYNFFKDKIHTIENSLNGRDVYLKHYREYVWPKFKENLARLGDSLFHTETINVQTICKGINIDLSLYYYNILNSYGAHLSAADIAAINHIKFNYETFIVKPEQCLADLPYNVKQSLLRLHKEIVSKSQITNKYFESNLTPEYIKLITEINRVYMAQEQAILKLCKEFGISYKPFACFQELPPYMHSLTSEARGEFVTETYQTINWNDPKYNEFQLYMRNIANKHYTQINRILGEAMVEGISPMAIELALATQQTIVFIKNLPPLEAALYTGLDRINYQINQLNAYIQIPKTLIQEPAELPHKAQAETIKTLFRQKNILIEFLRLVHENAPLNAKPHEWVKALKSLGKQTLPGELKEIFARFKIDKNIPKSRRTNKNNVNLLKEKINKHFSKFNYDMQVKPEFIGLDRTQPTKPNVQGFYLNWFTKAAIGLVFFHQMRVVADKFAHNDTSGALTHTAMLGGVFVGLNPHYWETMANLTQRQGLKRFYAGGGRFVSKAGVALMPVIIYDIANSSVGFRDEMAEYGVELQARYYSKDAANPHWVKQPFIAAGWGASWVCAHLFMGLEALCTKPVVGFNNHFIQKGKMDCYQDPELYIPEAYFMQMALELPIIKTFYREEQKKISALHTYPKGSLAAQNEALYYTQNLLHILCPQMFQYSQLVTLHVLDKELTKTQLSKQDFVQAIYEDYIDPTNIILVMPQPNGSYFIRHPLKISPIDQKGAIIEDSLILQNKNELISFIKKNADHCFVEVGSFSRPIINDKKEDLNQITALTTYLEALPKNEDGLAINASVPFFVYRQELSHKETQWQKQQTATPSLTHNARYQHLDHISKIMPIFKLFPEIVLYQPHPYFGVEVKSIHNRLYISELNLEKCLFLSSGQNANSFAVFDHKGSYLKDNLEAYNLFTFTSEYQKKGYHFITPDISQGKNHQRLAKKFCQLQLAPEIGITAIKRCTFADIRWDNALFVSQNEMMVWQAYDAGGIIIAQEAGLDKLSMYISAHYPQVQMFADIPFYQKAHEHIFDETLVLKTQFLTGISGLELAKKSSYLYDTTPHLLLYIHEAGYQLKDMAQNIIFETASLQLLDHYFSQEPDSLVLVNKSQLRDFEVLATNIITHKKVQNILQKTNFTLHMDIANKSLKIYNPSCLSTPKTFEYTKPETIDALFFTTPDKKVEYVIPQRTPLKIMAVQ